MLKLKAMFEELGVMASSETFFIFHARPGGILHKCSLCVEKEIFVHMLGGRADVRAIRNCT